jgi:hypothetical protein
MRSKLLTSLLSEESGSGMLSNYKYLIASFGLRRGTVFVAFFRLRLLRLADSVLCYSQQRVLLLLFLNDSLYSCHFHVGIQCTGYYRCVAEVELERSRTCTSIQSIVEGKL